MQQIIKTIKIEKAFKNSFENLLEKYRLNLNFTEEYLEYFDINTFKYSKGVNKGVSGTIVLNELNIFLTFYSGFFIQAYINAEVLQHCCLERNVRLMHFYEYTQTQKELLNKFESYFVTILSPYLKKHSINLS